MTASRACVAPPTARSVASRLPADRIVSESIADHAVLRHGGNQRVDVVSRMGERRPSRSRPGAPRPAPGRRSVRPPVHARSPRIRAGRSGCPFRDLMVEAGGMAHVQSGHNGRSRMPVLSRTCNRSRQCAMGANARTTAGCPRLLWSDDSSARPSGKSAAVPGRNNATGSDRMRIVLGLGCAMLLAGLQLQGRARPDACRRGTRSSWRSCPTPSSIRISPATKSATRPIIRLARLSSRPRSASSTSSCRTARRSATAFRWATRPMAGPAPP